MDDRPGLFAAVAGIALLVSFFLPWYEKSVIPVGSHQFVSQSLSAWGAFTWVEAALLLVDGSVLYLLYLRSTGRRVELPASDGTMIALAGGWMVILLLVRVFDRPSVSGAGASVGLQWGLLVAVFLDAGLNPVFILGLGPAPALGIAGSALATVIANFVALIGVIVFLYARDLPLRLRGPELLYLIPDRALLATMVRKGIPMGLQMIVISSSALATMGIAALRVEAAV